MFFIGAVSSLLNIGNMKINKVLYALINFTFSKLTSCSTIVTHIILHLGGLLNYLPHVNSVFIIETAVFSSTFKHH